MYIGRENRDMGGVNLSPHTRSLILANFSQDYTLRAYPSQTFSILLMVISATKECIS